MPLTAEVFADYDAGITETSIVSEAPAGAVLVEGYGFNEFLTAKDRRVSFPRKGVPDLLSVSVSVSRFLDRKTIRLAVSGKGTVSSVKVTAAGEGPENVVYDSTIL